MALTKERIIEAALRTLREAGFAGTSARAIARTGGFNQALIYYHFGSIENLLIAALHDFSARRLARYEAALEGVSSLTELVTVMTDLYRADVATGEVAAAQEVVAGSSSSPGMGRRVVELLDPWTRLAESVVGRVLGGTPFEAVLPAGDIAYALVALYFGVETLAHLDPDRARTQALFDAGARLAPVFDLILRGGG